MKSNSTATDQPAAGLSGIAVKTWDQNILFSVLVELTYRCNLDCSFCYNDTSLEGRPLSKEQYYRFFEDLADLQVLNLTLSGGEPLAHPHFFDLGARARELGFVVRVKSNGHALRGELARRLKEEVDPYIVEVSLHGSTAEVHDRQTRVTGSFERLMSNLVEMGELGLRTQINCTLTAWNEHQIGEMLAISDRLQVKMQIDPEVTPRDNGDKSPLDILPSREGIAQLFRMLRVRSEDGDGQAISVGPEGDTGLVPVRSRKHCGAGSSTVAVDPFGDVYPCVQWRLSSGNLHRQSIKEIWSGSSVLEDVREANQDVKKLIESLGDRGPRMGFCPGAAWINTGSPTAMYRSPLDKVGAREIGDGGAGSDLLPVIG
jgi:MoaA/NifB/PqqE/SkfB family radical SAM enzyme